jgi:hypothetical protein
MTKLRARDIKILDDVLSMREGCVLDFSDRTFAEFFDAEVGVDINLGRYRRDGHSKAKRLRCFVQIEKPQLVAKALRALWAYRESTDSVDLHPPAEKKNCDQYFEIVQRERKRSSSNRRH